MSTRRLLLALASAVSISTVAFAAPAPAPDTFTVSTDVMKATISNQGGDIVRVELLNYKERGDQQRNFVTFDEKHRYAAQSGLVEQGLPTHRTELKRIEGPSELASGVNELSVQLEATVDNGIKATKTLTFKRGSYVIDVAWKLANGSNKTLHPNAYFQFQRDNIPPPSETRMLSTFTGAAVFTEADKYQKVSFDDISSSKAKYARSADNGWLAMVQHYFVSAWVPKGNIQREFYMRQLDADSVFLTGIVLPMGAVAPGGQSEASMSLYTGPQEQSLLNGIAPGLNRVVDYGWLSFIATPIFWLLQVIHSLLGNWGWSIVVLTLAMKLLFYPLTATSYKSMARLKELSPQINELSEKYGEDKETLSRETIKLYQREKVNPLGGCLPILVQIPVFIALYWVLLGAVEMRDAPWMLWITDLSSADPYFVLPALMTLAMFVQAKLNPTPPDPTQARVMLAIPFLFGLMFLWFPSGLVLYWVVSTVFTVFQQLQVKRAFGITTKEGALADKSGGMIVQVAEVLAVKPNLDVVVFEQQKEDHTKQ